MRLIGRLRSLSEIYTRHQMPSFAPPEQLTCTGQHGACPSLRQPGQWCVEAWWSGGVLYCMPCAVLCCTGARRVSRPPRSKKACTHVPVQVPASGDPSVGCPTPHDALCLPGEVGLRSHVSVRFQALAGECLGSHYVASLSVRQ